MRSILKYITVSLVWVVCQPRRLFRRRRDINLKSRHCLVISLSGIGNAIMATPLIRALKQAGAATVDVLTAGEPNKIVFSGIRDSDTIYLFPRTWRQRISVFRALRKQNYDALFFAFPTPEISHALLPLWLAPGVSLTHDYRSFHPYFKFLRHVSDVVVPLKSDLHDIEQNLNVLSSLGQPYADFEHYPEFALSESAHVNASLYLSQHHMQENENLCFMHPGSTRGTDYKRWPVENFVELGTRLVQNHNARIVVIIGPDEKEYVPYFDQPDFYIADSSFDVTLALLSRARVLISNDSGLMHAAALLRIPTVTIWGGTDENRNGARGTTAINIINSNVRCRPCVRFFPQVNCPDTSFECIRGISVQRVYETILAAHVLKSENSNS